MINASFDFTKDTVNEKLRSPFWRNFIIGWITWNWQIWYITFFVSEEKTGNKIVYIKNMYTYFDFYNLFPSLSFILNWVILPLFIAYLMVYQIPKKITHKFDKEEKENRKRRNEALTGEIESETKVIKAQKENLKEKEELEEIKEKNKYEEWEKEFKNINKKHEGLDEELSKLIYQMYGFTRIYKKTNHGSIWLEFDYNDEMVLDSLGFIEKTGESGDDSKMGNAYRITEKGKYYLEKMSVGI